MERAVLSRASVRAFTFAIAVAGAGAVWAGCFNPHEPACAFSCGPAGACPADYACGADNLCHRTDGVGVCLLPPQGDGGVDSSAD